MNFGGYSSKPLRKVSFSLTDAQIKALPSTPIKLIDDTDSDKILIILFVVIRFKIVTPYTLSTEDPITPDSDVALTYGLNETNIGDGFAGDTVLGSSIDKISVISDARGLTDASVISSEGVYLSANSEDDADFVGGAAGNKISGDIYYTELAL